MAHKKYDGIVDAVRLDEQGRLKIVRIYERRGPIMSDHFIIDRDAFIKRLKEGQKFFSGKRIYKMGANFEPSEPVRVVSSNGSDFIVVGENDAAQDHLEGLPIF